MRGRAWLGSGGCGGGGVGRRRGCGRGDVAGGVEDGEGRVASGGWAAVGDAGGARHVCTWTGGLFPPAATDGRD